MYNLATTIKQTSYSKKTTFVNVNDFNDVALHQIGWEGIVVAWVILVVDVSRVEGQEFNKKQSLERLRDIDK